MRTSIFTGSSLFLVSSLMAQPVKLEIDSLPDYHSPAAAIYLAGSFNGWNPRDSNYRFQRNAAGKYFLDIKLDSGVYEYKITRGGWDKAECKRGGAPSGNRLLNVPGTDRVLLRVEEWADRFPAKPKTSSASAQVHIIDTAFLIPQLKRTRRIWIYLPEGYNTDTKTRYPVLYMHDGQNLFDDATSFSGEWGVDEFLDSCSLKKCIVIGIDHGGSRRLTEYNPYNNERFGKGEGDQYVDFLVKTLKPYIDKKYRTLSDKKNTLVAGSSMGGLISFYAVLKYPGIFGGAGVFSPSFWIAGNSIYDAIRLKGEKVDSRIYFYAGGGEGDTMLADMEKVVQVMKQVSPSVTKSHILENGTHNEPTWRKEFPLFYTWIME